MIWKIKSFRIEFKKEQMNGRILAVKYQKVWLSIEMDKKLILMESSSFINNFKFFVDLKRDSDIGHEKSLLYNPMKK